MWGTELGTFPAIVMRGLKGVMLKKKLLVLLIAVIPSLMPNLASAIAIDVEGVVRMPGGGDSLTKEVRSIVLRSAARRLVVRLCLIVCLLLLPPFLEGGGGYAAARAVDGCALS